MNEDTFNGPHSTLKCIAALLFPVETIKVNSSRGATANYGNSLLTVYLLGTNILQLQLSFYASFFKIWCQEIYQWI